MKKLLFPSKILDEILASFVIFFFFLLLKILKKHIHNGMRVNLYVGNFIGIRIISKSTRTNITLIRGKRRINSFRNLLQFILQSLK